MDVDPHLTAITDCLYRVSVKAIMVNGAKLLLTQEQEGWYSLPGGGIDYGEGILEASQRELEEEIEFHGCKLHIIPALLFATNREILDQIPRLQLYYRVELSEAGLITPKELPHIWASAADLNKLALSQSAQEAKPQLLSILAASSD